MTEAEIREATPEQLRVMVAEALGWRWMRLNMPDGLTTLVSAKDQNGRYAGEPMWLPSNADAPRYDDWETWVGWLPDWPNDIGAAWTLVRAPGTSVYLFRDIVETPMQSGDWHCVLSTKHGEAMAIGPTAPEAICRARLLAWYWTRGRMEK